jgi:hypothetical protein
MNKRNHRNNTIHFHQWSRKAYAVFMSLGRDVKICRLSVNMCEKSLLKIDNIISQLALPSVKEMEEEGLEDAVINIVDLNLCIEQVNKNDLNLRLNKG